MRNEPEMKKGMKKHREGRVKNLDRERVIEKEESSKKGKRKKRRWRKRIRERESAKWDSE